MNGVGERSIEVETKNEKSENSTMEGGDEKSENSE